MKLLRNLAKGNKLTFTVFAFIVILIIGILIWAVRIGIKNENEKYQVPNTSYLYDNDYNYIDLENAAQVFKKWTGSYYLKENVTKKEYKLGKYAVLYDSAKSSLELFGTFYQVLKGGEIVKYTEHNKLNKSFDSQFYKIDDRKYLIVAKDIKNNTGSLSTKNYLIVIMDKLGNALLLNNEINAKTIKQMVISTPDFDFDVGNEILIYGEENINLKKIIGSTNQYTPAPKIEEVEEEKQEENEDEEEVTLAESGGTQTTITSTNDSTNINNNSTTIVTNSGDLQNEDSVSDEGKNEKENSNNNAEEVDDSWVAPLNDWMNNVASGFQSIYNGNNGKKDDSELIRSVTLNKLASGTTYVDIDYTIIDPENKYNVVYATIQNNSMAKTISLDKNNTTYRVNDLLPDTNYIVELGYKEIKSDSSVEENVEDTMSIRTKNISESLVITKVSTSKIYYTLKLDSSYVCDPGCELVVYLNEETEYLRIPLSADNITTAAGSGLSGSFNKPSSYNSVDSSLKIVLENVKKDGKDLEKNLTYKIINY